MGGGGGGGGGSGAKNTHDIVYQGLTNCRAVSCRIIPETWHYQLSRTSLCCLCSVVIIRKPDHEDRREDIGDSHLRRLGSLHLRNPPHDIVLRLFHVSNGTTSYKLPTFFNADYEIYNFNVTE